MVIQENRVLDNLFRLEIPQINNSYPAISLIIDKEVVPIIIAFSFTQGWMVSIRPSEWLTIYVQATTGCVKGGAFHAIAITLPWIRRKDSDFLQYAH